jgi:hypothetical protein
MTSGYPESKAAATGVPRPRLEIVGQVEPTPLLMPVVIQNLSRSGATVAVTNPWVIPDWDRYHDRDCLLHLEAPGSQKPFTVKAKLAWSKFDSDSQLPLCLGLHLVNPSAEALRRLSEHIIHSPPDIKGLWERYDQVRKAPPYANLVHHFYLVGLVLLAGGVALQLVSPHFYKMLGWVLWLLGTLGIAGKLMQSFRLKRISQ